MYKPNAATFLRSCYTLGWVINRQHPGKFSEKFPNTNTWYCIGSALARSVKRLQQ